MTSVCPLGHKVLDCGLHVTFEEVAPQIFMCRSGKCEDLAPGPAWLHQPRPSIWRRFAAACGRAMRAEVGGEARAREGAQP